MNKKEQKPKEDEVTCRAIFGQAES